MRGKQSKQPNMFYAFNVEDRVRLETGIESGTWAGGR